MRYKIFDYDVWGNEIDGYTVNEKWPTPYIISIGRKDNKYHIVKKMIEIGFFNDEAIEKLLEIDVENTGDGVIYIDHNNIPHCELIAM